MVVIQSQGLIDEPIHSEQAWCDSTDMSLHLFCQHKAKRKTFLLLECLSCKRQVGSFRG